MARRRLGAKLKQDSVFRQTGLVVRAKPRNDGGDHPIGLSKLSLKFAATIFI